MVIDTSAVIAILQHEPEAQVFALAIERAERRLMSAVSMLETTILAQARKGDQGVAELDAFVRRAGIVVEPFDLEQLTAARSAFRRFGKGRHAARLNFGDCATYALAAVRSEPLLFKGRDFALTDIMPSFPADLGHP
jgi:ribonuclease VapC